MRREPLLRARSVIEKRLQRAGLLRPSTLPAFLGIGAQKSGTTWLHARLREHPSLFLPEEKELHYFDWNFHRPLGEYGRRFAGSGDRMPGEITPGYAVLSRERISFVAGIMPEVRLIYLMRDPVERAWSQVVMNAIEIDGEDPTLVDDAIWISRLGHSRVRRRGDHAAVLDAWSEYVPQEQIMIGWFEEIAEDPAGLLERIHGFLGVDSIPVDTSGVVRPGVPVPMPDGVRDELVAMLKSELEGLARRFGSPCERWLARWCG